LGSLARITPYTITQPGRLLDEIQRVHREGYATTVEEMSLGACSVAVPIRVADGNVVAALGIVVPSLKRDRAKLIAALQVAAHGIGRSLGT
jgi:DNA-binding IclR family transcriptional regulator